MIVTEQEAKNHICPFMTRPVVTPQQVVVEFVMCQGSACMGWRFRAEDLDDKRPEPRGICGPAYSFKPAPPRRGEL